jgi:hypothetical protein
MELKEYYTIISQKLNEGDYTTTNLNKINIHIEAINYILWEYMLDRNDLRINKVFEYVCIPNGVNNGEIDIDFSRYDTETFLKELMKLKD